MFTDMKDKVCLISGGAGGIGRATAEKMLEFGAKVFITDVTDQIVGGAVAELKKNGEADGYACDVTDAASVKAMVAKCVEVFGRIDILVNCAGIYKDVLFKDMTDEQWHQTINIDLNGVYNCTKAVTEIRQNHKPDIPGSCSGQCASLSLQRSKSRYYRSYRITCTRACRI